MPITLGAKVNSMHMNDLAPLVVFWGSFVFNNFLSKAIRKEQ